MSDLEQRLAGLSPAKKALLQARTQRREQEIRRAWTIPQRPNCDELPLSFAQERIWLHQQLVRGSVVYNRPANIRLRGPLRIDPLRQALSEVVARHGSLRTTVSRAGHLDIARDTVSVEMPFTDLSGAPSPEQLARQLATEEATRPFDLRQGLLLRSHLLRIGCEHHLLLLTFHHFTFDAWSQAVFLQELTQSYEGHTRGVKSPVEMPLIQYGDFAAWDRCEQRVAALEEGRSYWRRELVDPPVLQLPTDFPRAFVPSEKAGHVDVQLPGELVTRLRELAKREQTTVFSVLLASFTALLHRYTGDIDIVVGCPVAGRNRVELEHLIGVFINTLPLRTRLTAYDTFRQLLQRVRESVMRGLQCQEVPFQFIVQDVLTNRDLSGSPLFRAMFIHERLPLHPRAGGGVSFDPEDSGPAATMVDLSLELMESSTEVGGRLVYRHCLWEKTTIERLMGHFLMLLEGIVADADQRISDLPLLSAVERQQLLVQWNDTAVAYPQDRCVHEMFEGQAERTPDAVAVVFEEQELTYRQLNERANRLAHQLRSLGVGPDTLVGLCLDRSLELVVGLLGILKAGGAYVPLDANHPRQRLEFMLRDSAVAHLVTQKQLSERLPVPTDGMVLLDSDEAGWTEQARGNPKTGVAPHHLAYTMYTSGSTGQPKGVQVLHSAVVNLLRAMAARPGMTPADRLLSVTTPTFDISVLELLLPLTVGACVDVLPAAVVADAGALASRLASSGATLMQATPATWQMLIHGGWQGCRYLKALCGGEALPDSLAEELRSRCGELWNLYGPTETTIWSTTRQVTDERNSGCIGRPVANTHVYVLDKRGQPVPIGVPGELYIGGAGLARGYLNRPQLTAEKFVPNPFSSKPGSRLYRTGDLCRWRADGNLEFLGRLDDQVKLRGFRIELGEIEAVLHEHAGVAQSVVALREDVPGERRLVAYCVPAAQTDLNLSELQSHLSSRLPGYMVPAAFVTLDTLPMSPNGKVNRRALPAPGVSRPELNSQYAAPRNPIEEQLAGIWCELLGIERAGVHDDFFALGGHSLLAVRLFARIEKSFGRKLPLALLFQRGTIAHLAEMLSDSRPDTRIVSVLELQPNGDGRPLFLMPSIGGGLPFSRKILDELGDRFPVVGLQPALSPRNLELFRDIRTTASHILSALREYQPHGPYALTGFSYGGFLAFEVACLLRETGEAVDLLAIIDAGPERRGLGSRASGAWINLTRILANLPHWVREEFRDFSPGRWISNARRKLRYLCRRLTSGGRTSMGLDDLFDVSRIPTQNRELMQTVFAAFRDYTPRRYPGKLTLIRAQTRPLLSASSPDLGWSRFVEELEVRPINGNHETILHPPHVSELARHFRELLVSK